MTQIPSANSYLLRISIYGTLAKYSDFVYNELYVRLKMQSQALYLLKLRSHYNLICRTCNRRVRGAIRKAAKTGVTAYNTNSISDIESFYEIYLATQKRIGETSKPLPMLKSRLRGNISQLAIAKYSGVIIVGMLYLQFNSAVTLWVGAFVAAFWECRSQ